MRSLRAFRRKWLAYRVNGWRLFKQQSLFKVGFVFCFALGCEAGLWLLFRDGFRYLQTFGSIASLITASLFSLFFLGMGIMLVMSGVITSYSTLYRSDEIPYLLTRPLPVWQIVLYKFNEATRFSSWAFVFIIIPFVGAYAAHERLSALFAAWTLLFALPFLYICSGIGTLAIMALARWYPRRLGLKPVFALAAIVAALIVVRIVKGYGELEEAAFSMATLVPGMKLARNRLIPSTWVAEGILALARGQWFRGTMLWAVVSMSALAVTTCVEWLGSATFADAWESLEFGGRRRSRGSRVFVWGDRLLGFLRGDIKGMIMKDVRTFFRDPMQWSQVLIFFGLLAMYFANLRTFNYHTYSPQWRSMVSFLNVFSVSAVLCSLGSRFIYPQLSLEGQGFWLLGLAPTSMRRIVFSKLLLSIAATVGVSVVLIGMSTAMLQLDGLVRHVSILLIGCMALTISCLSTGLGALFIDLRQRNPAAIVGGFGGTVNLVISLAYMLATILPFGLLFHMRAQRVLVGDGFSRGLLACGLWLLALTAAVAATPVALGIRSLRNRDY